MTDIKTIPSAYDGREQALIKHKLLEAYLEKLFLIIGMGGRSKGSIELCYVDCFAGPWGDESVATTSIAISLQVLKSCRQTLDQLGVQANIRALYIEKDRKAFSRLEAYLATDVPQGISANCMNGDFVQLRGAILEWTGDKAFTFFFIDPKGWNDIRVDILLTLLKRPRSEFLINFMYNDVNRTMSMAEWQPLMKELLGESLDLKDFSALQREREILAVYRSSLKKSVVVDNPKYPARSAYVRILDPLKNRPKYHLVYVTTHPKGILEFMGISEKVDLIQRQVRTIKKENERELRTGTSDMFGGGDVLVDAGFSTDPADVDRYWLDYLQVSTRHVGRSEFAKILEDTDWFPSDLQASLLRLIQAGQVENIDAKGKRHKTPLHLGAGSGERLRKL